MADSKSASASAGGDDLAALVKTLIMENRRLQSSQTEQVNKIAEQVGNLAAAVAKGAAPPPSVGTSAGNLVPNGSIDQCKAIEALSNMIETFIYDEENGNTFEAWHNRFSGIIAVGSRDLDDNAKVELVLMKLETSANALYRRSIAPALHTDFTYAQTIEKLTALFKKKISLLRTRWNCLNVQRGPGEDIAAYGARINQEAEDFKLKDITGEQFKVLLFIMGIRDARDKNIRTRLLNLQDKTKAADVKLQTMVEEAERILQIEQDSGLGNQLEVHAVHVAPKRTSGKKASHSASTTPRTPCWKCGAMHFVKECKFADHTCTKCRRVGHKEGYCEVQGNRATNSRPQYQKGKQKSQQYKGVNVVAVNSSNTSERASGTRRYINARLNNIPLVLQFDTASDITILTEATWSKIGAPPLLPTLISPVDCQHNTFSLIGEINVQVECKGKKMDTRCFISKCTGDLFGADWIDKFGLAALPLDIICNRVETPKEPTLETDTVVANLQRDFQVVFSKTLGKCGLLKASLHLVPDAKPIFRQKRPVPYHVMALITEELERLEQSGVITPVQYSAFAAPIVVVRKANGTIRICGDYSTGLNDILQSHEYPIPTPEQIFASLSSARIFTQLDLSDAYLQVEMDEESSKLLTIHTHKGLFVFNRLCPGVKPAAGIFQQVMETILAGIEGVIIYFDDILIVSANHRDHQRTLLDVFEKLQQFDLRVRFEKCHFFQRQVRYLGVIVDANGQRPDPAKTAAIASMPPPKTTTEARAFLGAIGFYGRFIKDMSTIRGPIDKLMRKDTKFFWDSDCEAAFVRFKEILTSDLLLTHYNPQLPIMLASDASSIGIGSVAYHTYPDGSMKAFYHVSRRLTSAEQKYSQIEKEALGIIYSVKKFHKYVWGRRFTIYTDHRPLLTIFGGNKGVPVHTASRLQRWAVILLAYDFEIKFIGTEEFGHADVLSRLIADQPRSDEDIVIANIIAEEEVSIIAAEFTRFAPISFQRICEETSRDEALKTVIGFVVDGWPPMKQINQKEVLAFFHLKDELQITNDALIFRDRTVVPAALRHRVLASLHQAHPGICRMKSLARCYVFWPGVDKDIEALVANCVPCKQAQKAPTKVCLSSWPTPPHPWYRAHADFAGPVNGVWFLIVVDAYSKWPEVYTMSTTTTSATIKAFRELCARHGCMEKLVTDNGPQWTSAEFAEFCSQEAIEHIRTAPYMPMSNGQAERFVDSLKRALSKVPKINEASMQTFLRSYRATPSPRAPRGLSPAEIIYGRKIRLPVAIILPPVPQTEIERDINMEKQFNAKHGAIKRLFRGGDSVQVKIGPKAPWRDGQVLEAIGTVMYNVNINGRIHRVHANQIRGTAPALPADVLYDDAGPPAVPVMPPGDAVPVAATKKRNWRAGTRTSPVKLRPRK